MKAFAITLTALACCVAAGGKALPLEYGVKMGFNLAQHYGPKADETVYKVETGMRPGLTGGAFLNYRILDEVRLGYELLYSMKGSREKITILSMDGEILPKPAVMSVRYDLDYLEVPIDLRLRTFSTDNFALETIAGTAMSYKIHGHHELDGKVYIPDGEGFAEFPIHEESDLATVNQFDYSFIYGLAAQYRGKLKLDAEFRFTLGWDYLSLPTFSLEDPAVLRNQCYSLCLGMQF